MKTIFILSLLTSVIFFSACEDRKDYFAKGGFIPNVLIYKDNELKPAINDSLKIDRNASYSYKVECNSPVVMSSRVVNGDISVSISESDITVTSSRSGGGKVEVIATTELGKTGSCTMELWTFNNLPPVCNVIATIIDPDLIDVEIDASQSYDKDAKFGGKIIEYEFQIDDLEVITTTKPVIRQILRNSGVRTITARCKDDDNEWSLPKEIKLRL
ncbi:MAG: hypothetical protein LBG15_14720 [Dysgonamonadaceae bacterium]|jgi:hypothetical protein|nr:hypothetical protein [Dysgonamonadaceae bacterium]